MASRARLSLQLGDGQPAAHRVQPCGGQQHLAQLERGQRVASGPHHNKLDVCSGLGQGQHAACQPQTVLVPPGTVQRRGGSRGARSRLQDLGTTQRLAGPIPVGHPALSNEMQASSAPLRSSTASHSPWMRSGALPSAGPLARLAGLAASWAAGLLRPSLASAGVRSSCARVFISSSAMSKCFEAGEEGRCLLWMGQVQQASVGRCCLAQRHALCSAAGTAGLAALVQTALCGRPSSAQAACTRSRQAMQWRRYTHHQPRHLPSIVGIALRWRGCIGARRQHKHPDGGLGGWGTRTVAAGTLGRHMGLHLSCVWRRFNSTARGLANHPPPPAPVDATFRCHGPDHLLIRQLVALDSRQHNKVAVVCAGIGLQQSGIVIGQVVIPALA